MSHLDTQPLRVFTVAVAAQWANAFGYVLKDGSCQHLISFCLAVTQRLQGHVTTTPLQSWIWTRCEWGSDQRCFILSNTRAR